MGEQTKTQHDDQPLWSPTPEQMAQTQMAHFITAVSARWGISVDHYSTLYQWSIAHPEQFWSSMWEGDGLPVGAVIGEKGEDICRNITQMPGARWFPQSRLNFAENLLRRRDDALALTFWGEDRVKRELSYAQLSQAVAATAAAMRSMGVQKGDRVAVYMPNMPETVIAMLATASIGAIFTSASPDFGIQGVLDRFGQTAPKLLLSCDGYFYHHKTIEVLPKLADIVAQLPSVEKVVIVPYVSDHPDASACASAVLWNDFLAAHHSAPLLFEPLPFDQPLYILYSSGTTGVPKCIVHGAGGTLLQHRKEHLLHSDIRPDDRLFYFTTCGWMMWNWLVSGLAVGATVMLYDGSPFLRDGRVLFDYADAYRVTHFGTSAKFIDALLKAETRPRQTHQLDAMRVLLSTGSPLVPEGFDFIYQHIKEDLQVASISGGTDVMGCFVLGCPLLPVWRGEIQCKGLGMAVDVWDDNAEPVVQGKGELVCTQAFPSMPVSFWNDADGRRYHAAYFDRFDGVWCHGDFCEITAHGGIIIHGRSDATLNPGGVRIGTAEIYRQVEKLDEVMESIVIGQEWPPQTPSDVRVVLFVRLRDGLVLDEALITRIKQTIRDNTTPRHVPARVIQVNDIPRTKSGKLVELAVRNVVHGRPVKNENTLANPEALQFFSARAELEK